RRSSGMSLSGLPHSEILGSKPVCGSPKLFAAYHVLHRLLAPRHSPYALSSLTIETLELTLTASASLRPAPSKSSCWKLAAGSAKPPASAPCTLRVCGRKNYRLQDIQLSKMRESFRLPAPGCQPT